MTIIAGAERNEKIVMGDKIKRFTRVVKSGH
jgi:hypothetical protein